MITLVQKPPVLISSVKELTRLPLRTNKPKMVIFFQFSTLVVRRLKNFTLNFGPQHPAAHGILRILLQMSGEVIQQADAQFGLLHRGSEKLAENRNMLQTLPYFDRFDYVANFFQEHAYCVAVEAASLKRDVISFDVLACRTLFDELSRIANHLLTVSAVSMDMGAMAPIFWAFEEREQLMEFFERASGARMHTALYKPFGFDTSSINHKYLYDLAAFIKRSGRALSGAFLGLLNNRALKSRYANVGLLSQHKLSRYGISGIMLRSAGVASDLRLNLASSWGAYKTLSFKTFLGRRGDNLDRFVLRVKETVESFRIISQLLSALVKPSHKTRELIFQADSKQQSASRILPEIGDLNWPLNSKPVGSILPQTLHPIQTPTDSTWLQTLSSRGRFSGMEELISHFRHSSEGYPTQQGLFYGEVESPKGFVGVVLVTNASSRPVRMKLRSPVAHNLNLLPSISVGSLFADFVATFCSFDVVLGEIDR